VDSYRVSATRALPENLDTNAIFDGLGTSPREERAVIREALDIFGAALLRLGSLSVEG
jgi:hypothetical protein